jgi:hypothetical protein
MKRYIAAGTSLSLLLIGGWIVLRLNSPADVGPVPASDAPAVQARDLSSLPKVAGRIPTTANPVERLDRESEGKWNLKRDRAGFVKRMTGGSLPLGMKAPSLAADEFVRRYAQGLLGVDPSSLLPGDSRQEGVTSQVIYSQEKDGLPVFGTRVNMIFDREGNLVHLVSDLHAGSFPASSPKLEVNSAAAAVRLGLVQRLERDGEALEEEALSITALASQARLGYRMVGASVSLVYRFEFSLADERYGDMEAIVDAQSGSLTALRTLSRN